jgi:uncharacterized membrane protein
MPIRGRIDRGGRTYYPAMAEGPIDMSTARLEAFSDGVMAVIITILALELSPPTGVTIEAVKEVLPDLAIFVLAFAFLAIYWNNHHHLMRATDRISGAVMWANMLLLLCLSLIPVLTEWVKGAPTEPVPVSAFGVVSLAPAIAYYLLVRAIIRANGRDSVVARAIRSDVKGKVSPIMYIVGAALAPVSVWISYVLYVAVAVMWVIPDRRFTQEW